MSTLEQYTGSYRILKSFMDDRIFERIEPDEVLNYLGAEEDILRGMLQCLAEFRAEQERARRKLAA